MLPAVSSNNTFAPCMMPFIDPSPTMKAPTISTNLERFGIGGLDQMKEELINKVILPRIDPNYKQYGSTPASGILLYGPPGTGKTLTARSLGEIFRSLDVPISVNVINGPEVLSKHVGESERKIRELFSPHFKTANEIHILIFDEIDAIGAKRGSSGSDTFRESVLTQLLTMMDGTDSSGHRKSDQILVIGLTNRIDILDPALTRPGRFDISCHIGLPDENGRLQIFNIHTRYLRENHLLAVDVRPRELISLMENYSGSDIKDVVQRATQFANSRNYRVQGASFILKDDVATHPEKVSMKDFQLALKMATLQTGISDEIKLHAPKKYICFNASIRKFIEEFKVIYQQTASEEAPRYLPTCWLLDGASDAGKTALAVHLAMKSKCPSVFMLSALNLAHLDTAEKIRKIEVIEQKAKETMGAIVILDDFDGILGRVGEGLSYNIAMLESLLSIFTMPEKRSHKIHYIATTHSQQFLKVLNLQHVFHQKVFTLPLVTTPKELQCIYEKKQLDASSSRALEQQLPAPVGKVIEEMEFINFSRD